MKYKKILAGLALMAVLSSNFSYAAPYQFKTFQRIPVWDKHLTPLDENGQYITLPKKTTFATEKASEDQIIKFYSPATEKGKEIVMKFVIDTEAKKEWFDNISQVAVVNEYGTQQGDALSYRTLTDDPKYPTTKSISIYPNRILENNKKHQIRIKSTKGETQYFGVHVIESKKPELIMSMPSVPKLGEDIVFKIKDMNYPILNPITSVELSLKNDPSSKRKLQYSEEYWLIGDVFRIFNKAIEKEGEYQVIVHAEGFHSFETLFEVKGRAEAIHGGKASESSKSKVLGSKVDTVSAATGGGSIGGGSSSGGGGGSLNVQADIIFNEDLLSNARLLSELGIKNEAAAKVVERWKYDGIIDLVMNDGFQDVYTYNEYFNAVQQAKLREKKYLTFEEFIRSGATENKNRPYEVHHVLENGKLGAAQRTTSQIGKNTPKFAIRQMELGKDIIIEFENAKEYLEAFEKIVSSGSYLNIASSDYEVKVNENQIILKSSKFNRGKSSIEILAKAYKPLKVSFDLQPQIENIELTAGGKLQLGYEVQIGGMNEDFIKNVKNIQVDGQPILPREGQGKVDPIKDTYFYWNGDILVISAGTFKETKEYTVMLEADHYLPKQVRFTLKPQEEISDAELVESILDIEKKTVKDFVWDKELLAVKIKDADAKLDLQRKGLQVFINGQKQASAWTIGSMNRSSAYIWSEDTPELLILPEALLGKNDVIQLVVGEQEVMFELDGLVQKEKRSGTKGTLTPQYELSQLKNELLAKIEKAKAIDPSGKSETKVEELKVLVADIEKQIDSLSKDELKNRIQELNTKIEEVNNSKPDAPSNNEKREATEEEKKFPEVKSVYGTDFKNLTVENRTEKAKLTNLVKKVFVNENEYGYEMPKIVHMKPENPKPKKYDFESGYSHGMRLAITDFKNRTGVQDKLVLQSDDRELVIELESNKLIKQTEYILPSTGTNDHSQPPQGGDSSGSGNQTPSPGEGGQPTPPPAEEKNWVEITDESEKLFPELESYSIYNGFAPNRFKFKSKDDLIKMKNLLQEKTLTVNETTYGYQEVVLGFGGYASKPPTENKFQFFLDSWGVNHYFELWYGAFTGNDMITIEASDAEGQKHKLEIVIEKEKLVSQKEYRYQ